MGPYKGPTLGVEGTLEEGTEDLWGDVSPIIVSGDLIQDVEIHFVQFNN